MTPGILIFFSIAMGVDNYSFELNSIETYAPNFLDIIIYSLIDASRCRHSVLEYIQQISNKFELESISNKSFEKNECVIM